MKVKIGIIGGSGVYNLDGLENPNWIRVKSPWGKTSDDILTGNLNDIELAFLPRHSRNHNISPSDIPYQANIDALKRLEVTDIISVSACGSLNENYKPGDFVLVDQYIDRTFKREKSFFGAGCVAHVSMAHPTCERLSNLLFEAGKKINLNIFKGGTYLTMEGPQFSTLAESLLYKNVWNCASQTFENAKIGVAGYADEDLFNVSAEKSLRYILKRIDIKKEFNVLDSLAARGT